MNFSFAVFLFFELSRLIDLVNIICGRIKSVKSRDDGDN